MNKVIMICLLLLPATAWAQQKSIAVGASIGEFDGLYEIGTGYRVSVGYRHSFWKNRLRLGPELSTGSFTDWGITDIPDQYFNLTQLSLATEVDAIRYRAFALFAGVEAGALSSRGFIGRGGWPGTNDYGHFHRVHAVINAKAGLRIAPLKKKWTVECIPLSLSTGTRRAYWGGVELKFGWRF